MSAIVRVTRRDFLIKTGVGTGALVLGCYISPQGLFAENILHKPFNLNNWVAIEPLTGEIHIMSHRSEMGQGIRSSLAAVLGVAIMVGPALADSRLLGDVLAFGMTAFLAVMMVFLRKRRSVDMMPALERAWALQVADPPPGW